MNEPVPALIKNLLVYSNSVGVFNRNIGAITYENLISISNVNHMTVAEPNLSRDSQAHTISAIFVGNSALNSASTNRVLTTPRKSGFLFKNILFKDFTSG